MKKDESDKSELSKLGLFTHKVEHALATINRLSAMTRVDRRTIEKVFSDNDVRPVMEKSGAYYYDCPTAMLAIFVWRNQ